MYKFIFLYSFLMAVIFGCQRAGSDGINDMNEAEPIRDSRTVWTDSLEVFVDYPVMVAGASCPLTIHLTKMSGHDPLDSVRLDLAFIHTGRSINVDEHKRLTAGIFQMDITPEKRGTHSMRLNVAVPGFKQTVVFPEIMVYESLDAAQRAMADEADGTSIEFFKNQAWQMDFQTEKVGKGDVYNVLPTSGRWMRTPGNEQTLAATTGGIVTYARNFLMPGSKVNKGDVLVRVKSESLVDNNLAAKREKAQATLDKAKSEYDRKAALYASKIIPRSEFEAVEERYRLAQIEYNTLEEGYGAGGNVIRAPITGYIQKMHVSNGDYVQQGGELATISSNDSRLLVTQIPVDAAGSLKQIHDIWYKPDGKHWSSLMESGGRILSVDQSVEPGNPMLRIVANIREPVDQPMGAFTEVHVGLGESKESIVVPRAALLEEYGQFSVIVQLGGEEFEQRPLNIGRRNGAYAEVLNGLDTGELIVTQGAYQVKMASMSGQAPGHGHSH